jgi:ligand-binding sensor domain-containing protein/putative methionine-R-sulfoxide reductase with GAF domain/two-component sensor histidine kinase
MQSTLVAQLPDYQVKMLTEQQGLQPAEFISIARDAAGFLWLLSPTKVQRYDGQQSWTYPVPAGADELYIDRQAHTWMISRRHVHRFVNTYKGFTAIPVANESGINICLFYAHDVLYLLLSDGLQRYDESTDQFVSAEHSFIPGHLRFTTAYGANDDYLFLSTADSIYSLHLHSLALRASPFKRIASLTALSGDRVFASNQTLASYVVQPGATDMQPITTQQFETTVQSPFIRIFNGVPLGNEQYHLTTSRGLLQFDSRTNTFSEPVFYHRGEQITNTLSVRRIFRDAAGTIFMTMADGVAYYHPHRKDITYIRNYQFGTVSLPDTDIRSFAEDDDGYLWIATLNGLARLDRMSGALKTFLAGEENSIDYPSIRYLLYHNKHLWIGTSGKGIWVYNPATDQFSRPLPKSDTISHTLNEEFIWRMSSLQNGDVFVAGGNHCYVIDQKWKARRLDDETFQGISRSATQDASGRIWHGTATGLNCTDSDFKLLFRIRDSFPDKRIAAFCEWQRDRMLIGTKGLYEVKCEGNRIVSFAQRTDFPAARFIFTMEQDDAGTVWLGTDEGLYRFDPVTGQYEAFGMADNVQPQAFNSNGLYRSHSGVMYAGGIGGMNFFDPDDIEVVKSNLQPGIASFAIGDDDSTYHITTSPLTVPYSNRILSAEISVPEYEKPHVLQYRYKTNIGDEWVMNGNSRFIRLHNFSPGTYELLVAASVDGIHWYPSAQGVSFAIKSPWWKQWWFVLTMMLAFSMIVYWILHSIRRRRERKEHQAIVDYFANSGYEQSNVEYILWDIAMNCISRMGFEECVIYLVDAKRNVLVQKAAYGPKSPRQFEISNAIEIPIGKGITGTVAQTGVAEIVNNTPQDPRYLVDDEARQSEITVPILFDGKVIGIIDSEHSRKNFFTQEHLQTLTTIAGICSVKIARGLSMEEIKKAEGLLRELNTKMLETKYLNLRLQMNPHFLFNSLSSIQHLVVSQQTNDAYTYLSVFSHFLRSVLQYADRNVITLDEELKMLEMYIKLERLGSDKGFDFTIEVDESLDIEDVLIPPLMIQPIIENAIWHGLMPKEGEKRLSVAFANDDDENLVCTIDDNGIGRQEASNEKKHMDNMAYQSKAMMLIEERLELLQQKTGKPASMSIEDKQLHGRPAGTRVRIMLPFYNPDEV